MNLTSVPLGLKKQGAAEVLQINRRNVNGNDGHDDNDKPRAHTKREKEEGRQTEKPWTLLPCLPY